MLHIVKDPMDPLLNQYWWVPRAQAIYQPHLGSRLVHNVEGEETAVFGKVQENKIARKERKKEGLVRSLLSCCRREVWAGKSTFPFWSITSYVRGEPQMTRLLYLHTYIYIKSTFRSRNESWMSYKPWETSGINGVIWNGCHCPILKHLRWNVTIY